MGVLILGIAALMLSSCDEPTPDPQVSRGQTLVGIVAATDGFATVIVSDPEAIGEISGSGAITAGPDTARLIAVADENLCLVLSPLYPTACYTASLTGLSTELTYALDFAIAGGPTVQGSTVPPGPPLIRESNPSSLELNHLGGGGAGPDTFRVHFSLPARSELIQVALEPRTVYPTSVPVTQCHLSATPDHYSGEFDGEESVIVGVFQATCGETFDSLRVQIDLRVFDDNYSAYYAQAVLGEVIRGGYGIQGVPGVWGSYASDTTSILLIP